MNQTAPTMRELKARAQKLKQIIHLGHDGVTDALISAIDRALADHGLIKIRFTDHQSARKSLTAEILQRSGARPVLLVGHTATIYRQPAA